MRPASMVACRWALLKLAGTVMHRARSPRRTGAVCAHWLQDTTASARDLRDGVLAVRAGHHHLLVVALLQLVGHAVLDQLGTPRSRRSAPSAAWRSRRCRSGRRSGGPRRRTRTASTRRAARSPPTGGAAAPAGRARRPPRRRRTAGDHRVRRPEIDPQNGHRFILPGAAGLMRAVSDGACPPHSRAGVGGPTSWAYRWATAGVGCWARCE
jgi:hypothetical protein